MKKSISKDWLAFYRVIALFVFFAINFLVVFIIKSLIISILLWILFLLIYIAGYLALRKLVKQEKQ